MQRVSILGIDRGPQGSPALGINADTLFGLIVLSDADGRFTGNPLDRGTAVHAGVDKSRTLVQGSRCTVTSVPFTYGGAQARITVIGDSSTESAGFQIVNDANGVVMLDFEPKPFDFGVVSVQA
jgi:hypothetical protein